MKSLIILKIVLKMLDLDNGLSREMKEYETLSLSVIISFSSVSSGRGRGLMEINNRVSQSVQLLSHVRLFATL